MFAIGDVNYRTLNGVPNQVTYYTTPYAAPLYLKPFGLFVQDQLKIRRWTINAGLRYDQFRTLVRRDPPRARCAGCRWRATIPEPKSSTGRTCRRGSVSRTTCSAPARTALKFSLSRYVLQEGKDNTNNVHPVIAATNSVSRTWTDGNGDFVVQGDPLNPATNGELGPSPNTNFGKPKRRSASIPDWATGFNARPYNWEMLVTLQHELAAARGGRGLVQPALVRQLHRQRQHAGEPARLRPVLHHVAASTLAFPTAAASRSAASST